MQGIFYYVLMYSCRSIVLNTRCWMHMINWGRILRIKSIFYSNCDLFHQSSFHMHHGCDFAMVKSIFAGTVGKTGKNLYFVSVVDSVLEMGNFMKWNASSKYWSIQRTLKRVISRRNGTMMPMHLTNQGPG